MHLPKSHFTALNGKAIEMIDLAPQGTKIMAGNSDPFWHCGKRGVWQA